VYQALYRKYRPRTFDDVVGQEKVTETLKSQIESGRLSHAYLFVGTRGTGKTTCAKILARAVNCEHPENGNPCNKCKSCLGIEDGSIMDVVELDAASNNGVDNVRALRDEAVYSPAVVKKRVYIIDEVHMLSTSAFNALLKILEEPPEHLMFILATTELNKVPATILSRCQRYRFRRIDTDVIADRLRYVAQQENIHLDSDAADLIAMLADGALRDGLSLLDQCSGTQPITVEDVQFTIGLADKNSTANLLSAIIAGQTEAAVELFEAFWREGKSPSALLSALCSLLRDILMLKVAPKGGRELLSAGFDRKTLEGFAGHMTSEQLLAYMDTISARLGSLRDGRDPKIACELCIIGMCRPELGDDLASLRERVARMEQSVSANAVAYVINPESPVEPPQQAKSEPEHDDEPPFDIPEPSNPSGEKPIHSNNEPSQEKSAPKSDEASFSQPEEACTDGDFWCELNAELKKNMKPFHYAHLSGANAALEGDTVVIRASSNFHKKELEKPELQEHIRNAVTFVLGGPHPVIIKETTQRSEENADKLDELLKFGNVKCE
jgi:DNA polymerase-3 subunit gamma/tau